MSEQPLPYKISVPDETLHELKQRLAWSKFPSQLESPSQDLWDFGVPTKEIQRLQSYWRDGYEWRRAEAQLNELPQYQTDIEIERFGIIKIHCNFSHSLPNLDSHHSLFSC